MLINVRVCFCILPLQEMPDAKLFAQSVKCLTRNRANDHLIFASANVAVYKRKFVTLNVAVNIQQIAARLQQLSNQ